MQYKIPKFINSFHAAGNQPNEIYIWLAANYCRCKFCRHPGEMWLPAGLLPVCIDHLVDHQLDANFAEVSG
jgi:hypothetical protein